MSRRQILASALTLLAVLGSSSCSDSGNFHAQCDTLALTSSLERRIEFRVPQHQMHSFNDALVSYLQNAGFTYQTSEDPGYRSPPDSNGVQTQFLNIKTIGCTPRAIVWSENVVSEDAFMITVHRTQNGTKASADGIASDLQRILANTLRNEPNPRHAMR